MDVITGITLGGALGLVVGLLAGAWGRDVYWTSKADGEPRAHGRGKLYHVIRDGDVDKAKRVANYGE